MRAKDTRIDELELTRLGIRLVEGEVFQWGEYIFSNLNDALAAARRAEKR